jgi:hypothetical protein
MQGCPGKESGEATSMEEQAGLPRGSNQAATLRDVESPAPVTVTAYTKSDLVLEGRESGDTVTGAPAAPACGGGAGIQQAEGLPQAKKGTAYSFKAKPAEKPARVVEMPAVNSFVERVGEALEEEPQPDSSLQHQSDGQAGGQTQELSGRIPNMILKQNLGKAHQAKGRPVAGFTKMLSKSEGNSGHLAPPRQPNPFEPLQQPLQSPPLPSRPVSSVTRQATPRFGGGRGTLAKFKPPRQTSAASLGQLANTAFRSPVEARPATLAHKGRSLAPPGVCRTVASDGGPV